MEKGLLTLETVPWVNLNQAPEDGHPFAPLHTEPNSTCSQPHTEQIMYVAVPHEKY